ncbi:unnamed protein product [Brassica rapa]|uniref:Uncharacterized protein n=1 Tax=Brassica campestris TaxID=3711 RepID=A0A8D9FWM4_BRACM|nr:unnamed protein product [Brassica rapa]
MEVVHIHVPWRLGFQERGDHYKRAMESSRKSENPLGVFLGRAEADAEVLTGKRHVWID